MEVGGNLTMKPKWGKLSLSYMGAGSPRDGFRDPDLVVLWFFFHLKCNPFQITRLWERLRLVEWGW